jgi:hypothetical protein
MTVHHGPCPWWPQVEGAKRRWGKRGTPASAARCLVREFGMIQGRDDWCGCWVVGSVWSSLQHGACQMATVGGELCSWEIASPRQGLAALALPCGGRLHGAGVWSRVQEGHGERGGSHDGDSWHALAWTASWEKDPRGGSRMWGACWSGTDAMCGRNTLRVSGWLIMAIDQKGQGGSRRARQLFDRRLARLGRLMQ